LNVAQRHHRTAAKNSTAAGLILPPCALLGVVRCRAFPQRQW
jgi:hypothetical protein